MAAVPHILALDWSGAVRAARRKIWLAEADGSALLRLENGRDRTEVADHLIALASEHPDLIVGLDFAFSFPAWFLRQHGFSSAHDLWAASEERGEQWLKTCPSPFWGRPGRPRPANVPDLFRRTELEVPAMAGIRPKSVFQIGGAGAVGTGSIRGMAVLHRLSEAGFSVWPFDPPRLPVVVEIYPRLLTGPVNKSSQVDRVQYLGDRLHGDLLEKAASTEDAFDAAVSALVMAAHREELLALQQAQDDVERLEGRIWVSAGHPGAPVAGSSP